VGAEKIKGAEYVPGACKPQIQGTAQRARQAGAQGPLKFIGCGMTAMVYEDSRGRCFKTARQDTPAARSMLRDEAAWLKAAGAVSGVREHVVKLERWHEEPATIERACAKGRPGTWSQESKLRDLHADIEKKMVPHGWTAPEFKGDSYIADDDGQGRPVLVDAGFASRVGRALLEHVAAMWACRKPKDNSSPSDNAFYLRSEVDRTLTKAQIAKIEPKLGKAGSAWPKCPR